jgi:exopolysaccharide biosynthesis polyprenyl glycosylphosphotransferase
MTAINEHSSRAGNTSSTVREPAEPATTWQRRYARWLVISDAASIIASISLAQWLRFGGFEGRNRDWMYLQLSTVIAVAWVAALAINHSRSERIIGSGAEEYRRVWLGTISTFGAVAIISMLLKLDIARGYLAIGLPVGAGLLLLSRWLARQLVRRARERHGSCRTRVTIIGSAGAVRDLAIALSREPRAGFVVAGACILGSRTAGAMAIPGIGSIPTFGDESNAVNAVCSTGSSAVAVTAAENLDGRKINALSWDLEKLKVDLLVVPSVLDVAGPRLHMRPVAGLPLIHVEKPQYHGAKRFQKRAFDVIFSSAVLLCALPLLAAIAIAIKLTSKGPVIYRQERIGLNGKTFQIIKFRTMVVGAEALALELAQQNLAGSPRDPFKFVDDPRVTTVGRLLRKYSLDEIPQFVNVLKREMSVVGPRPQVLAEVEAYDACARRRLLVRPGITGLWQVSGRSDLSWEDSVRLDLFYVENWSMMADMLIAMQTAKVVFSHSGAY